MYREEIAQPYMCPVLLRYPERNNVGDSQFLFPSPAVAHSGHPLHGGPLKALYLMPCWVTGDVHSEHWAFADIKESASRSISDISSTLLLEMLLFDRMTLSEYNWHSVHPSKQAQHFSCYLHILLFFSALLFIYTGWKKTELNQLKGKP